MSMANGLGSSVAQGSTIQWSVQGIVRLFTFPSVVQSPTYFLSLTFFYNTFLLCSPFIAYICNIAIEVFEASGI